MVISIEVVAELQAEMTAGDEAAAVLARRGLVDSEYLAAKEGHLRAIADEVQGGRRALLQRYQRAFLARARALEAERAQGDAPKPSGPKLQSAASSAPSKRVVATPLPAPLPSPASSSADPPPTPTAPAMPSYLRAGAQAPPTAVVITPQPPAPVAPRPDLGKMTIAAPTSPRSAPTPFRAPGTPTPARPFAAPPASASSAPPASGAPASVRIDTGTLAVDPGPDRPSKTGTIAASGDAAVVSPLTPDEIRRHATCKAELKLAKEPRDVILGRWSLDASSLAALDARWSVQFVSDGASRSVWMSTYSARLSAG